MRLTRIDYTLTCAELIPLGGIVRSGSSPQCRISRVKSIALSPWRFSIFLPRHPRMCVCTWACISPLRTHTHAYSAVYSSRASLYRCIGLNWWARKLNPVLMYLKSRVTSKQGWGEHHMALRNICIQLQHYMNRIPKPCHDQSANHKQF